MHGLGHWICAATHPRSATRVADIPFDLGVRTVSSMGMPLPLENSLEASILVLLILVPSGNRHIQKVRDRVWRSEVLSAGGTNRRVHMTG